MKHVNLPKVLKRSYYQQCKDSFVEISKNEPGIVAIYLGGTESSPGISDLDFVLCLEDKVFGKFEIEKRLDPLLKEILSSGTILKVNEKNFGDIKMIDNFPLSHLSGKKFMFKEFESLEFEICRVMDWLPERLHTLLRLKERESVDVLLGLQIMKSLTVSLKKLSLIVDSNYDEYINSVIKLRGHWFENDDRLINFDDVLNNSVVVAQKAMDDMSQWLLDSGYMKEDFSDCYGEILNIKGGPKFEFAEKSSVKNGKVMIPVVFRGFFWAQANISNNSISNSLKLSFSTGSSKEKEDEFIDKRLLLVIHKRMRYVEKLALFLRNNNISSGLLKYGWFL